MKNIIAVIVIMLLSASVSFAGSKVDGKVMNNAKVKESMNTATGKDSKANMGSIKMR